MQKKPKTDALNVFEKSNRKMPEITTKKGVGRMITTNKSLNTRNNEESKEDVKMTKTKNNQKRKARNVMENPEFNSLIIKTGEQYNLVDELCKLYGKLEWEINNLFFRESLSPKLERDVFSDYTGPFNEDPLYKRIEEQFGETPYSPYKYDELISESDYYTHEALLYDEDIELYVDDVQANEGVTLEDYYDWFVEQINYLCKQIEWFVLRIDASCGMDFITRLSSCDIDELDQIDLTSDETEKKIEKRKRRLVIKTKEQFDTVMDLVRFFNELNWFEERIFMREIPISELQENLFCDDEEWSDVKPLNEKIKELFGISAYTPFMDEELESIETLYVEDRGIYLWDHDCYVEFNKKMEHLKDEIGAFLRKVDSENNTKFIECLDLYYYGSEENLWRKVRYMY